MTAPAAAQRQRRARPASPSSSRKPLISALVALVLFSLMIGIRTEAGPTGQLIYWTRFGDLAAIVAAVFGGSIVVELLRQWWGPVGTVRVVPPPVQSALAVARRADRAGAADLHLPGAGDLLRSALHSRSRHPGADLCDAGMGTERGGRPRRPARSRLCRVLRRRRLFLRAARDQFRAVVLGLPAAGRHPRRASGACCSAFRCCGCAATISRS